MGPKVVPEPSVRRFPRERTQPQRHRRRPAAVSRLTEEACWQQLRSSFEGIRTYRSGRGLSTRPALYVVKDGALILHLAAFNPACQYIPGQEVELEVQCLAGP